MKCWQEKALTRELFFHQQANEKVHTPIHRTREIHASQQQQTGKREGEGGEGEIKIILRLSSNKHTNLFETYLPRAIVSVLA